MPAKTRRKAAHPSTRAAAVAAARHLATAWQEPVCVIRAEKDGGPFVRRQSLCAGVDPRRVIETVEPGVPWIGDGA
jgi:hypothetical protein